MREYHLCAKSFRTRRKALRPGKQQQHHDEITQSGEERHLEKKSGQAGTMTFFFHLMFFRMFLAAK